MGDLARSSVLREDITVAGQRRDHTGFPRRSLALARRVSSSIRLSLPSVHPDRTQGQGEATKVAMDQLSSLVADSGRLSGGLPVP